METRWRAASGSMHLNKQVGASAGYSSVDDARAALGQRHPSVGMQLDDGRVHLFDVKGRGPEDIQRFDPTDQRVVLEA